MPENFANRYQTALAAGVTSGAATGTVTSVTGVPAYPFRAIISSEGANTDEIVLVTGRSGTTLTWTRAAEAVAGVQAASAHGIGATFTSIQTAVGLLNVAGHYNVRAYGAVGDGVTDDGTAIQAAITAAAGADVYFPAGTYLITASIAAANYVRLRGASPTLSIIKQATSNVPVIKWGGYGSLLSDLSFTYSTAQAAGNTGAVGIELYAPSWSVMERVTVDRANVGIGIKYAATSIGGGSGTVNYVASCSFRDLIILGFSVTGLSLVPFNGGNSGSAFNNIYILCRDNQGASMDVTTGLTIAASDGVFNQLNVEAGSPVNAIYAYNCGALTFNSVHLEALTPRGDSQGFLHFEGGSYIVNGLLVASCNILIGNVATVYGILRVEDDTRVMLDGLEELLSTVTTPNFYEWLVSGSTGTEVYARGINTSGVTSEGYFPVASVRKQISGDVQGLTTWYGLISSTVGYGSPEGVYTANVGSLFHRADGGAGTSLYIKESGAGNTGWVAK